MGKYSFIVASTAFILLLNLTVTSYPGQIQELTGLDTESLQDSTNVSASIDSSKTGQTSVLDQVSSVVSVYTKPQSENRILASILTVYAVAIIILLIDIIWVG